MHREGSEIWGTKAEIKEKKENMWKEKTGKEWRKIQKGNERLGLKKKIKKQGERLKGKNVQEGQRIRKRRVTSS